MGEKEDILEDNTTTTGATHISAFQTSSASDCTMTLGFADKAIITKENLTLIPQIKEKAKIDSRLNQLYNLAHSENNNLAKARTLARIARLFCGVAFIHISALSEIAVHERKFRVEDALCSAKSSIDDGLVVGGCRSLIEISEALKRECALRHWSNEQERFGFDIMASSISSHFDLLAANSGRNGNLLREYILATDNPSFGYNAIKDNCEDLFLCGVMDPSKVIRCAIDNSSSVSNSFLSIRCAILLHRT